MLLEHLMALIPGSPLKHLKNCIKGTPKFLINVHNRPLEAYEFDPTDEEFLIICGLKEVKEMYMQVAGREGVYY
jgi:hypothetical protein